MDQDKISSEIRKKIIELHNKHLSVYYIKIKIKIPQGIIEQIIAENCEKENEL